jgi:predicted RNA binding protein YcfA (HicA-like mRNA interferase family)
MPLSGKEMLRLFELSGWTILRQKGSHIRLAKGIERETIPLHKELANGTERFPLKRLKEVG